MSDKNSPSDEISVLEEMKRELLGAVDAVRTEARDMAVGAVREFARDLDKQRSAKPPVPAKETNRSENRGDVHECRDIVIRGDGRDAMYSRLRKGLSGDDLYASRAARNPKVDELAKAWVNAVGRGDVGERIRAYHEANDAYLGAMGVSRASLLEGSPSGEDPLSDGSGAELLPLPLANQLIIERDRASVFRKLVNVFPMSSQTSRIPVLPKMTATSRAENAAFADVTTTADAALLTAKDIGLMFSAGRNFLEDTAFNIANQLTVGAGMAIGAEEDVQICTAQVTADAADLTEGLDKATITNATTTTANVIQYQDIVTLFYAVPKEYRRNAKFFATSTALSDLATVLDSNGRPILLNAVEAPRAIGDGDPDVVGFILGKPIYDVPVADDQLYFGDPQWYALGQRMGIRVDSDRAVTTGNRQWVIDERIDGRVIPTSVVGTNNAWRSLSW